MATDHKVIAAVACLNLLVLAGAMTYWPIVNRQLAFMLAFWLTGSAWLTFVSLGAPSTPLGVAGAIWYEHVVLAMMLFLIAAMAVLGRAIGAPRLSLAIDRKHSLGMAVGWWILFAGCAFAAGPQGSPIFVFALVLVAGCLAVLLGATG